MCLHERSLWGMFFLTLFTFGFYFIYWTVKVKGELNCRGASIPTAFLIIIPVANLYFWYKFAEAFQQQIARESNAIAEFLLMVLLPAIGMFIIQSRINDLVRRHRANQQ